MITKTYLMDKSLGLTAKELLEVFAYDPSAIAQHPELYCTNPKCEESHLYIRLTFEIRSQSPRKRYKKRESKK